MSNGTDLPGNVCDRKAHQICQRSSSGLKLITNLHKWWTRVLQTLHMPDHEQKVNQNSMRPSGFDLAWSRGRHVLPSWLVITTPGSANKDALIAVFRFAKGSVWRLGGLKAIRLAPITQNITSHHTKFIVFPQPNE